MLRRFLNWLSGKPSTPHRPPAAPSKAAPRAKARFDEKLLSREDDDKTVRDTSDDVTIRNPSERAAASPLPKPAGFRFNPNLNAAMPADDANMTALAQEIAERVRRTSLPLEFQSLAFEGLSVVLTGTYGRVRVVLEQGWSGQPDALRAALEAQGIELEAIDARK